MVFSGKRKFFLKQNSVSPHFILLLAFTNNATLKKKCVTLNSIDMKRPLIDTRLLFRNCEINFLKLGSSEQIRKTNLWGNRKIEVYVIYKLNNKS